MMSMCLCMGASSRRVPNLRTWLFFLSLLDQSQIAYYAASPHHLLLQGTSSRVVVAIFPSFASNYFLIIIIVVVIIIGVKRPACLQQYLSWSYSAFLVYWEQAAFLFARPASACRLYGGLCFGCGPRQKRPVCGHQPGFLLRASSGPLLRCVLLALQFPQSDLGCTL